MFGYSNQKFSLPRLHRKQNFTTVKRISYFFLGSMASLSLNCDGAEAWGKQENFRGKLCETNWTQTTAAFANQTNSVKIKIK